MKDALIDELASAAGLGQTLAKFEDDVRAAARQVTADREALRKFPAPTDEPWPPMQVPRHDG